MNDDRKEHALAAWSKLLEELKIQMNAEEQYDELLKLAEDDKRAGVNDDDDWREFPEEATPLYAHLVEGPERET